MLVQRSDSGDLHVRRHATWGMSVKTGNKFDQTATVKLNFAFDEFEF